MRSYKTISEVLQKQNVFLGPATVNLVVKSLNIKIGNNNEVIEISSTEKEVLKSLSDKFVDLAGTISNKPIEQFIH
ncbi:hypothetical protein A3F07_01055 [candidate division WWE3 bacterium RIFCSPHIGHO2_12_FULL_38_15]|uniref:Uncharacterized protein n=1 Tax=candidate division WWE3 bacterium RIFCSPHIGHO2_02_FULL_38_14 TaxID=1802620 RepID=A0A1F4VA23_UNCKA|nr:MAG: hypothetical protein A2793_03745 [candidate division WWE3 bacterium RIFCSPHIGHO2_01_FULL_38_45]OGC49163.1 MAG: hypothetical protein A3F07_01055 [candidate division WWE3 bacterium RIFCSPHIGHO2_12_FULL_38_15]OGC52571.1 MAG: hypothetical protein A3B64_03350 [candidate division WWE3 bacterium RIFCSPLOWO2_01_FULL_37_24]OGC54062.1 MAG: hypothetical protein A3D91_04875 [candidate division WWE3 bacterium RIFCSPHIGHO2_02_FULL_38_14]HLB51766.1 hypothetical protein [Patescibacteria group bacterium